MPPQAEQKLTISGTSAASAVVASNSCGSLPTRVCRVAFGASPTATVPKPADDRGFDGIFGVTPGHKIAVIAAAARRPCSACLQTFGDPRAGARRGCGLVPAPSGPPAPKPGCGSTRATLPFSGKTRRHHARQHRGRWRDSSNPVGLALD